MGIAGFSILTFGLHPADTFQLLTQVKGVCSQHPYCQIAPMRFDLIMPLNHPEVSGPQVPWKFRVLASEMNRQKSSSFDGTLDN